MDPPTFNFLADMRRKSEYGVSILRRLNLPAPVLPSQFNSTVQLPYLTLHFLAVLEILSQESLKAAQVRSYNFLSST